MKRISRRRILTGAALLVLGDRLAVSEVIQGKLPAPAMPVPPGSAGAAGWRFFTPAEVLTIEAVVDRVIPPDPVTPGGKAAGCAVFIDRQLDGGYGHRQGWYTRGPFDKGSKEQGPQSDKNPAQQYRAALASLDQQARAQRSAGRAVSGFADLTADEQDAILKGIESGTVELGALDGKEFFKNLLTDVQQGFFSDPLYGGNRDMCGWKMIGFPGARYDYRDWVSRHNEPYPHPPVSIQGRADWNPKD